MYISTSVFAAKNLIKARIWQQISTKNRFFCISPKRWLAVLLPKKWAFSFKNKDLSLFCQFVLLYLFIQPSIFAFIRPLYLSGTYCHKTGTKTPKLSAPQQRTIYPSHIWGWYSNSSENRFFLAGIWTHALTSRKPSC